MPGLTPPVKEEPKRLFLKMLVLVVLLLGAGVAIWHTSTQQRVALTETASIAELGLDPDVIFTVDGISIYVAERTSGTDPVLLLHDVDVSGSVTFDGVVESIGTGARVVTVDLPGFGLSQRIPEPGAPHTVASMGRTVAALLEARYPTGAVLVGVGLGGEVAAEVAATRGSLVKGLVLVDVDFWPQERWRARSQRLPFIGASMTFHYEASGSGSAGIWAPHCGSGGWCPSADQVVRRQVIVGLANTSASLNAFRHTPKSSFVPEDLDKIDVPVAYVWSSRGSVPRASVDRIGSDIPQMTVTDVDGRRAHLEAPETIAEAVATVLAR